MNQEYASINSESPREPQGYPQVHPPQGQQVFMPVYTQSQVTQEAPQGIQRTMPAAAGNGCQWAANLTLEQTKERMISAKKRVKCSSRTFMLYGVIGLGISIWQCYRARQIALNIVQGRKAFGPPEPPIDDEYGYPDHEAQWKREAELGAQTMTRDELASYDLMKTISFLVFLLSVLNFGLGKLGMRTVWREKSQCANRISKKSCIGLVFITIFGLMLRNEGGELHKIIKRNQVKPIKGAYERFMNLAKNTNITNSLNTTDEFNLTEPFTRLLDSQQEFSFGDDVEDICEALDNDGCESDDRCSWCKSAAVASACKSVDTAKALPSSIFDCDNLDGQDGDEFIPRAHHGERNHHGKGPRDHQGKGPRDHHGKGPSGHHGKGPRDHEKRDGHHGHHGPPPKGCCMKYLGIIYAFTLVFHMCNLRCYFHKLNAWETKRVEAGEVLSDDGWGCGPWKKHWKKKQEQRRVNQTGNVQRSETTTQIDSSSTQMN